MPSRSSGSASTSTVRYRGATWFRRSTPAALKPQRGASFVPFMNSTTSSAATMASILDLSAGEIVSFISCSCDLGSKCEVQRRFAYHYGVALQLPSLTKDGAVMFASGDELEASWSTYVSKGALPVKPARELSPLEHLE